MQIHYSAAEQRRARRSKEERSSNAWMQDNIVFLPPSTTSKCLLLGTSWPSKANSWSCPGGSAASLACHNGILNHAGDIEILYRGDEAHPCVALIMNYVPSTFMRTCSPLQPTLNFRSTRTKWLVSSLMIFLTHHLGWNVDILLKNILNLKLHLLNSFLFLWANQIQLDVVFLNANIYYLIYWNNTCLFIKTSAAAMCRIKRKEFTRGYVNDPCAGLCTIATRLYVTTWPKLDWGASLLWQMWLGLPFSKDVCKLRMIHPRAHPQRLSRWA